MHPSNAPKLTGLPVGVYVVGRAVGDFTFRTIPTQKGGAPLQVVEGQVLAGTTFCNVSERVEQGQVPHIPHDGEEVRAWVVPDYRSNNVFKSSVRMERPTVVAAEPVAAAGGKK